MPNVWAVRMPNGTLLSWLDGSLHVPELFGTRKAAGSTLRLLRSEGIKAKAVRVQIIEEAKR